MFVQRDIDAVALASEGEDLLRRFCQLNDSLAALSDDALVSIGKPAIPEERDRAALIGAASRTAIGPQDWGIRHGSMPPTSSQGSPYSMRRRS